MKTQFHFAALERSASPPTHLEARPAGFWAVLGLLATLAFFVVPPARAGVIEAWVQRYNHVVAGANDYASKVVRDAAGDIIVSGITEGDMLTIKYSGAGGAVLWQKRYNGPANGDDVASAVVVDGSGNVVVTGYSYNGTNSDYYTAKYASLDGALLWENRYNGPADGDDSASAVAVDATGNVVVTGSSAGSGGSRNYYTAKYAAADGTLLWEHRYGSPANNYDGAVAVAVDGNGNVVVTGSSRNGAPKFDWDYYTAKYAAADGALLWDQRYNGPANLYDNASALALDGDGNVVVTGSSEGGTDTLGNPNVDFYTAKYAAADGALLWGKRSNNAATSVINLASAVAVDSSGNVVMTGYSHDPLNFAADYYTAKYAAADGALLWERRYNGPPNGLDQPSGVVVNGSGDVVVTGRSEGSGGFDYYTAKYAASDGALLWEKRYNGPANNHDEASGLTVDGTGNVVVTGASNNGNNNDFYTAKYAATDGALLWEMRYDGPTQAYDEARAVAVDGSGNVAVTGISQNGAPSFDSVFYTAKYAVSGALLWEKRYTGPAGANGEANAVAVDGSGNVVVTGRSQNDGPNSATDYYTAKYAAVDGVLLWEKRYNGPANDFDIATALAVDGGGNVVVTGSSRSGNGDNDFYTAKYAAADGALRWEKRYNGPANGEDSAKAIALDADGNAVVTGSSFSGLSPNGSPNYDYYTAKYAAADGALLWEKRYDGPANSSDEAKAVAVDASGNVAVTGISLGSEGSYDYYTAKYAGSDGALLWEKRYNGPTNAQDFASGVAVDRNGNVVVTGSSYISGVPPDQYTAKYAAADGALLWEKRRSGGGVPGAEASSVAVDTGGNVVVTGGVYDDTSGFDYYTAKYAAADGALLWEKRYNGGPANGADFVGTGRSLALGPNGMVAVTGTSINGSSSGDFATVVYLENLLPLSIDLVPAGVRIRFTGAVGHSYEVQRAPAVTGPWSTLATPTAPSGSLIEYVDINPPTAAAFYRLRSP